MCLISVVTTVVATYFGYTRAHYRAQLATRLFFPIFVCFMSAITNLILATPINEDDGSFWIKIFYVLHAARAPMMLLTTFELCYVVHKRRSVKFCCILFDNRGHRVSNNIISCILRNSIWALSSLMFITGIAVDLGLLTHQGPSFEDDEMGVTGFLEFAEEGGEKREGAFAALIPWLVVSICNIYLTLTLWKYGSFSAMVVHTSYFNPWMWPMIGTCFLIGCFCVKYENFLIASNTGIVIMTISILFLMKEIDRDLLAQEEFSNFLRNVSKTGNACHTPSLPPPTLSMDRKNEENGEGNLTESSVKEFESEVTV